MMIPRGRPRDEDRGYLAREDVGYHKGLSPRQLQMIAMGGAIGTGLFLGAGERLANAGPSLFLVYAVCGGFVYLVLRALGELVLHRPSSGSFVSYAREFLGERAAYVAGWMYFFGWAMVAIADSTAIATYLHYWAIFRAVPQALFALIALAAVLGLNIMSVKVFGELEFWAAMVKVLALITFLIVGTIFLAGRFRIHGQSTGFRVIAESGGLLPNGLLPLVMVTSGVLVAYGGAELVGTAAGETALSETTVPRAINSVIARIALFYVGSLFLLGLLLLHTAYKDSESPFVTFFSEVGVAGAGTIMNVVVLTAALSSLNAGLYSTGRILRSMAINGSAPKFTLRMSKRGVPYGGICLTVVIGLFGVLLNGLVPAQAFDIVLNMAALGIIAAWATIVICQIQLYRWSKRGIVTRPTFRMWGAPYSGYLTLAFLFAVVVLMALDPPIGTWTVAAMALAVPALIIGWRTRVRTMQASGS